MFEHTILRTATVELKEYRVAHPSTSKHYVAHSMKGNKTSSLGIKVPVKEEENVLQQQTQAAVGESGYTDSSYGGSANSVAVGMQTGVKSKSGARVMPVVYHPVVYHQYWFHDRINGNITDFWNNQGISIFCDILDDPSPISNVIGKGGRN